jgi:hypothetical protein
MPVNVMLIRALLQFYLFYGDNFKVECPTGSGNRMNLFEVSKEISSRLQRIFLRDERGRRPVYGRTEKFQTDLHWRDHLLFYEYFHGDDGAGLGASHQTGWTGLIAKLIQLYGSLDPIKVLAEPRRSGARVRPEFGSAEEGFNQFLSVACVYLPGLRLSPVSVEARPDSIEARSDGGCLYQFRSGIREI